MSWSPQEEDYRHGIGAVQQFQAIHGRLPRQDEGDESGFPVGVWLSTRRRDWREGKLSEEQIVELAALGVTPGPRSATWEAGFDHLVEFAGEHGHARVSQRYECDDGFPLGTWVNRQRREYRNGTLDSGRIERLEGQGMVWDVRAADWEEGFRHVVAYLEREGTAAVPVNYVDPADRYRTGSWVNLQRTNRNQGVGLVMEADRARRLEELTGWVWNARSEASGRGI
jgi:hypothetical protein